MKAKFIQKKVRFDVFFLGFILFGSQVVLFRELLIVCSGNELVVGFMLSVWLIGGALGSAMAYRLKKVSYKHLFFTTFYPLFSIMAMEWFYHDLITPGRMLTPLDTLLYTFLLLFPVSFAGGIFFIKRSQENNEKAALYAAESLGSLTAGALLGFVLIYWLELGNVQSLLWLSAVVVLYVLTAAFILHFPLKFKVFTATALLVLLTGTTVDIDKVLKQRLFNNRQILETKETPYGNITVTKQGNQINFFENGQLLFNDHNVQQREEDVHFAMLQRRNAQKVLVLGGGMSGTLNEILKYSAIKKVTCVEENGGLIELSERYIGLPRDERVEVVHQDPLVFLKHCRSVYDVVLVNRPVPANAGMNRFFTVEFYLLLKKATASNGVFSTRIPVSENYQSEEEVDMLAAVYHSLLAVFPHVLLVPSNSKVYLLASSDTLSLQIAHLYKKAAIRNSFVNDDYINDRLIGFRSAQIIGTLQGKIIENHRFRPVIYLAFLKHWLGFFKLDIRFLIWPVAVVLLLLLLWFKPESKAMFASGFTGASAEIVLIAVFQMTLGNLYLAVGLLIAAFMAGLAAGSSQSSGKLPVQLTGFLFYGIMGLWLWLGGTVNVLWIAVMLFTAGWLTGKQYALSVRHGSTASVYSADLTGAALGSFLTAVYLIPQMGIVFTVLFFASIHLVILFMKILR